MADPFYNHHRRDDEIINAGVLASEANNEMLHLHARSVEIPISENKPPIFVEANPPEHMMKKLKILGYK